MFFFQKTKHLYFDIHNLIKRHDNNNVNNQHVPTNLFIFIQSLKLYINNMSFSFYDNL